MKYKKGDKVVVEIKDTGINVVGKALYYATNRENPSAYPIQERFILGKLSDFTKPGKIRFTEEEKKEFDALYGKLVKSSISNVYETMCDLLKSSNYPALNTYVDNSLIKEVDLMNLFYKLLPIEVVKGESKK